MKGCRRRLLLIVSLAWLLSHPLDTEAEETRRLALLIAAPWEKDQAAMRNDIAVMTETLRARNFSQEEILTLEGPLDRQKLMAFLQAAQSRVAGWPEGALFLYISGQGGFTGATVSLARPALMLANSLPDDTTHWVFWDEVFSVLRAPDNVQIILFPDT